MPLIIVDSDEENPIIKNVDSDDEFESKKRVKWIDDPENPGELISVEISCEKQSKSETKSLDNETEPTRSKEKEENSDLLSSEPNFENKKSKRKSSFLKTLDEDLEDLVVTIPAQEQYDTNHETENKAISGDLLNGKLVKKRVTSPQKEEEHESDTLNLFEENLDDLSDDQQNIYAQIIGSNKSGFLTGGPGTGKTYLVTKLMKYWINHRKLFCLTSTTGVAAHVLNQAINKIFGDQNGETPEYVPYATTFHHAFSIPPDMLDKYPIPAELMLKIKSICGSKSKTVSHVGDNEMCVATLATASIIVIDEVSMFPAMLLQQLDQVLKAIHSCSDPFGGVQIIFCGDFFQLPPIQSSVFGKYAFQSQSWYEANPKWHELETNQRQNDSGLKYLIDCVRKGELDEKAREILIDRVGAYIPGLVVDYPEDPTEDFPVIAPVITLFPSRKEVEDYNKKKFEELPGETWVFLPSKIHVEGHVPDSLISKYTKVLEERTKQCTDEKLVLKKGALVMLTVNTNVNAGLVNGATGVVVGFNNNCPIVKFSSINNPVVVTRHTWKQYIRDKFKVPTRYKKSKQVDRFLWMNHIPLRLAWAMTVHKAQGCTLPAISVCINSQFATPGLALVALSRVPSVECLQIIDWDLATLQSVDPIVREFYKTRGQSIYSKDNPALRLLSSAYPPKFNPSKSIDSGSRMMNRGRFGAILTPKVAFQKQQPSLPLPPRVSTTKKFPLF